MSLLKRPVTPRQKMINLMYIVLMAMVAINVSPEILDGFNLMNLSLSRTTANSNKENCSLYDHFVSERQKNPVKASEWFKKAQSVNIWCDGLYEYCEKLKKDIAVQADGIGGDPYNLVHKDDIEAATHVLLAPNSKQGEKLYEAISDFREKMLYVLTDSAKRAVIADCFSTKVPKPNGDGKNWQEYMFESMPAIAAVSMLTKLQSDIRYAEGEVLHTLMDRIGQSDIRVNSVQAFVIPEATTIIKGNEYKATVVMAAVDTTKKPNIFLSDSQLPVRDGFIRRLCNQSGNFHLNGYLLTEDNDGNYVKRYFDEPYTVIEPFATVSADNMNVLYSGWDNPVSVSVPGIALSSVNLTAEDGTLTKIADGKYIVRPSKVGSNVILSVWTNNQVVDKFSFKTRQLPEPLPYIETKDNKGVAVRNYAGAVERNQLLAANGICAAIDDGMLDVQFKVLDFETIFFDNMGNAMPVMSNGNRFSDRQREIIGKLTRNRRFYVSHINAVGPDNIERKLKTSLEIIVK